MKFSEYLQNHQPFVYHTFANALKYNKISQAYLIKGTDGAPVFECAKYLAKSLVCEESDFACDECLDCIRFDEGNYSDMMIVDGASGTIKVSDIEKIQSFLSSSSLERRGIKIYIINELENANKESVNALLKTLEEPAPNTYAFITTRNESKILQTILSRCQILHLLPIDKTSVIKEVTAKGVPLEDAEILSSFYTDEKAIMEAVEGASYKKCKEEVMNVLNAFYLSKEKALYCIESSTVAKIKTKEDARFFFDLLALAFKDMLHLQLDQPMVMSGQEELLRKLAKKYKDVQKYYLEIMLTRGKIEMNVSIALLLEHVFIYILKGGKDHGTN